MCYKNKEIPAKLLLQIGSGSKHLGATLSGAARRGVASRSTRALHSTPKFYEILRFGSKTFYGYFMITFIHSYFLPAQFFIIIYLTARTSTTRISDESCNISCKLSIEPKAMNRLWDLSQEYLIFRDRKITLNDALNVS